MIKLALDILGDKEKRNKVLIFVLSIVVGVVLLMFAPVAVLMTMQEIEPPDMEFDQSAWMQSLDSERQSALLQMEADGLMIASAMEAAGVREQIIKAQLIYVSCFDGVVVDDFNAYANLFKDSPDDAALIDSINQTYGLEIVYEDFMRSYAFISHVVTNPYVFTDAQSKNATEPTEEGV